MATVSFEEQIMSKDKYPITPYPTRANGIIVLVNSQTGRVLPPILISTTLQSENF